MKRVFCLLTILLFAVSCALAGPFSLDIGTSKEDMIKEMGKPLIDGRVYWLAVDADVIVYNQVYVSGFAAKCWCVLKNNKLVSKVYGFNEVARKAYDYLDGKLSTMYGDSVFDPYIIVDNTDKISTLTISSDQRETMASQLILNIDGGGAFCKTWSVDGTDIAICYEPGNDVTFLCYFEKSNDESMASTSSETQSSTTVDVVNEDSTTSNSANQDGWVCSQCGYDGIGNFCNNCGSPRPVETVVPEEVMSDEWDCPNCGYHATGNFCSNCGSARGSNGAAAVEVTSETNESNSMASETATPKPGSNREEEVTSAPATEPPKKTGGSNYSLESAVAYMLSPNNQSLQVSAIELGGGSFTAAAAGKSYYGYYMADDDSYMIEIALTNPDTTGDYEDPPYNYMSDGFRQLMNFLMEKNNRTVVSVYPILGDIYGAKDSKGNTYMIQAAYSESIIVISLTSWNQ